MEYLDVNKIDDNGIGYKTPYKEYTKKIQIKTDCYANYTDRSSKLLEKNSLIKSKNRDCLSKIGCYTQRHFTNECPGGSLCINYQTMKKLEIEIQKLAITIDRLTKVNEYFNFTLNQKNKIFKSIISNNDNNRKQEPFMSNYSEQPISLRIIKNISGKSLSQRKIKPKENNTIHARYLSQYNIKTVHNGDTRCYSIKGNKTELLHNKPSKLQAPMTEHNQYSPNERDDLLTQNNESNNHVNRKSSQLSNAFLHYDNIIKKTQKHTLYNSAGVSFIALSNEQLNEIAYNSSIKILIGLTQSDEEFIQLMHDSSKETLFHYCNIISSLIKDFQSVIFLIKRIKMSISCSFNLINSVLSEESPLNLFINNACLLFNCEQASLYLLDSISDQLLVYSTDDEKENIPDKQGKYEGLIGCCFLKSEKIKIDFISQDSRCKKDIKYRDKIRNLMCYPISDKDGDTIGVIEVLNKKQEHFDTNDEEFFNIYTNQLSIILQNLQNNESASTQLKRLKLIINYSIEISSMYSIELFLKKTEAIVKSLFSSPNAVIYFNNNVKGLYNSSNNKWIKHCNIGIINHVIKKKECYGCTKISNSKYHNSLIDLITDGSLVTYPIINYTNDNEVIAVIQVQFYNNLCTITELPKKSEMDIFKLLDQCFISWYKKNNSDKL